MAMSFSLSSGAKIAPSRQVASRRAVAVRPVVVAQAAVGAAAPASPTRGVPEDVTLESARAQLAAQMQWFRVPPKVYFKGGCLEVALAELVGKRRALVVTDKNVVDMSLAERVTELLDRFNIQHQTFYHVSSEVSASTLSAGLREINDFKPDVIIAVGGGAPMDAAKAMWLLYESPATSLQQLISEAAKGRHNIGTATQLGQKALCVCVPTTSGTGAEVTPFALVKDEATGRRVTLSSYSMTPSMAVVDPQLVMQLPRAQTAYGGQLTLSHALESYISVFASDYSKSLSKHALAMMNRYYARAYRNGPMDYHAREKMHNAATVAGMAFANAYLGALHSLASEVSQASGAHLGLVTGVLLPHVLAFMARDPATKEALADLSDLLHVGGSTVDERYKAVMDWVQGLGTSADIPTTLQAALGSQVCSTLSGRVDALCSAALEDAHVIASPVQPTPADLKAILVAAGL